MTRSTRRVLEALGVGQDIKGGEATAPIAPDTIYAIADAVSGLGFDADALVRSTREGTTTIAQGATAVEAYVEHIRQHADHAHWPGDVLVFRARASDTRLAVTSDSDGSVIQLVAWGVETEEVLKQVLKRLWMKIRRSQDN